MADPLAAPVAAPATLTVLQKAALATSQAKAQELELYEDNLGTVEGDAHKKAWQAAIAADNAVETLLEREILDTPQAQIAYAAMTSATQTLTNVTEEIAADTAAL